MIVQRLRAIQNEFGYLPDEQLRRLARETNTPLYRIQEVASFFALFRQEWDPPPYVQVQICRDMTCHLRGASKLLSSEGLKTLENATGHPVEVIGVSCLGRCDRAPALVVSRHPHGEPCEPVHEVVYAGRSPDQFRNLVEQVIAGKEPSRPDFDADYRPAGYEPRKWLIDPYAVHPEFKPYEAIKRYLLAHPREVPPPPKEVDAKALPGYVEKNHPFLWKMSLSGLQGMGGAGMLAYEKWLGVWQEKEPIKYVVCNGDESEPGTFKDRELLLRTPHLVVEGVILAGLMSNATQGYIYIRHEYHEQIEAVREAIERAIELRACGDNLFGTERSFMVEVFESPGGYICGEQSALIEAMEDRRAQPRNKPPELLTNGLRDKPTVVNNVETLSWAPAIMLFGGEWYAGLGKPGFKGRRFFSISGDVTKPGVYEVPNGLTLRELVDDYAGGMKDGKPLKAVATSGPSGGLLPAKLPVDARTIANLEKAIDGFAKRSKTDAQAMKNFVTAALPPGANEFSVLDIPLDLNFFRNLHSAFRFPVEMMLGAGLAVFADPTDVLDQAVNFNRFFRNESCGKCVPCRIGSQKLVEIGTDLLALRAAGRASPAEVAAAWKDVRELTDVLQKTSICGLGYVAPSPLASALAYFPTEVVSRSLSQGGFGIASSRRDKPPKLP